MPANELCWLTWRRSLVKERPESNAESPLLRRVRLLDCTTPMLRQRATRLRRADDGELSPLNKMKPDISIVVPLCNEAPNVLPLAQRVLAALDAFATEIILVDDGSTDDTWARMLEARRGDARGRGVRQGRNVG